MGGEVLEIQNASLRDEYKKLLVEKRRKLDDKNCESNVKDKYSQWSQESQDSQPRMNQDNQLENEHVSMNNYYNENFYNDCYNNSNHSNSSFESTKDFNYYDGFFAININQ